MDDKRIGVLFMQSQDFFGADSQIHASIMRHLDRERFDVHCAVPKDRGGKPSASAVAVRKIPDLSLRPTDFGPSLDAGSRAEFALGALRRGAPAVWSMLGLVRYIRRHEIRVVHCTEKPRDAIFGSLVARLAGAECVIHVHVKAENWIRSAVRRSMHRAAALIGVSEFVAGSIRELGYDSDKVVAVLNGLEVAEWADADDIDGAAVRREFDISPEVPLLVSAARLYRYKGQHDLLAALPAVKARVPDVKVLIVGEDDPRGFPGEASYSEVLRGLCDELDLWDNVVFTGWRTDVRALMVASDLYVMPSFEEPFGMVFIESMFLRRPVVAVDNGGTREVVDNGGSGLLSAPGDIEGLSENLLALLEDPERRALMGEHGRERVLTLLNSERMTREVEDVYELVVSRAG